MVLVNTATSLLQILHLNSLAARDPLGNMEIQAFHHYTLGTHGGYNLLLFTSPFMDLISVHVVPQERTCI